MYTKEKDASNPVHNPLHEGIYTAENSAIVVSEDAGHIHVTEATDVRDRIQYLQWHIIDDHGPMQL